MPFFDNYEDAEFQSGDRVVKSVCEDRDLHPLGTVGTVLGSLGHPKVGYGYLIQWDGETVETFVINWKVKRHGCS